MAAPIFDSVDVERNKITAGLGYILPFVPYFACRNSAFGRYCANQGLILWLAMLLIAILFGVVGGILGWIPLVGGMVRWILNIAKDVLNLGIFAVMAYCTFIAITRGRATEVPVVGSLQLIK